MSPDGRFCPQEFKRNYSWQEQFDQRIREIIGSLLLQQTDLYRDRDEASDYELVYAARDSDFRCTARMKRPEHYLYRDDITFRAWAPSGLPVELDKILDGHNTWMFSGYSTGNGLEIDPWWVISLDEFRRLHAAYGDSIWTAMNLVNSQDHKEFHKLCPYRMLHGFGSDTMVVGTSREWPPASQGALAF